MRRFRMALVAGIVSKIDVVGDNFLLKSALGDITLEVPNLNIKTLFSQGMSLKFQKNYEQLWLSAETDQVIELYAGAGDIIDGSFTGEMSIKQSLSINNALPVTVGLAAVALIAAGSGRQSVRIQNLGGAAIYIGGAGVTAADGLQLNPNETFIEDNAADAVIYAISSVAGQDVRVQYV